MDLRLKRRREHTRERIVAAAAKVFANKGVAGATVDDLSQAAGFTRGAFYSNFATKEEVFTETLTTFTQELVTRIYDEIEILDREVAPETAMRAILRATRPQGQLWVLLEAEGMRQALVNDSIRDVYLKNRDYLARALVHVLSTSATDFHHQSLTWERTAEELQNLAELILATYAQVLMLDHLQGEDSTERLLDLLQTLIFPLND
ncbi:MAG: TetR family transcriptional regulator [Actinomycetaceae bacterium]|nr:TetR family transcriptional regulator [Actinomycetaceae bacterium]